MKFQGMASLVCQVILLVVLQLSLAESRSFTVDNTTGWMMKDGEPFRYVSGCFHYFRAPRQMWKDIMTKMRDGGLNVLETYIEWRTHEPEPGLYNFQGDADVVSFLETAQEVGLLVVLRPGPYICAERDFGGLPYWLHREKPDIDLRSIDPVYLKYVDKWFDIFLPMMEPLLYQNGGPIILVQVENEYGQYPKCDHQYMTHIRDLNRKHLGQDVVLFRTDIPEKIFYDCDKVDDVLVTADLGVGTDIKTAIDVVNSYGKQPFIVTEFYVGWMDHWGEPHAKVDKAGVIKTFTEILANNGSVSIYMYYGGTNYGFSNGANGPFSIQPTSYDYAAPISECGDLSEPYFYLRDIISQYMPLPPAPKPSSTPKVTIDNVSLTLMGTLLENARENAGSRVYSEYPLTFEQLSIDTGFVSYSTMIPFIPDDPMVLAVPGLRDRASIYIDDRYVPGILSRHEEVYSTSISIRKGQILTIIVENQGRINYGLEMKDPKGIVQNVTLGTHVLSEWTMNSVPLTSLGKLRTCSCAGAIPGTCPFQPAFFTGTFVLPEYTPTNAVTFLDPTNWHRGVAFVNGFNLGRYWPIVGPQVTLFVPANLLKPYPQQNVVTLLELEHSPCAVGQSCEIKFVDTPNLDGPVPLGGVSSQLNWTILYDLPDSVFGIPENHWN